MENGKLLRKEKLKKRDSLTKEEIIEKSKKIEEKLLQLNELKKLRIFLYMLIFAVRLKQKIALIFY